MMTFIRWLARGLLLVAIGFLLWAAAQPPHADQCADRRQFDLGGSTLGVHGTYCARWNSK
jgi:hypothetical protein